MTLLPRIKALQ